MEYATHRPCIFTMFSLCIRMMTRLCREKCSIQFRGSNEWLVALLYPLADKLYRSLGGKRTVYNLISCLHERKLIQGHSSGYLKLHSVFELDVSLLRRVYVHVCVYILNIYYIYYHNVCVCVCVFVRV